MVPDRFQITVGRTLHAMFWLAVSATLFGITALSFGPMPDNDLRAVWALGALGTLFIGAGLLCGRRALRCRGRAMFVLIAIGCWQVVCLGMMVIYAPTVGQIVLTAYTTWIGDVQASYGTYARVATYCAIVTVTISATMASLWLFKALSHEAGHWRKAATVFLFWEVFNVALLGWSFESGLPMMLNSLGWSIFGAPDDLYSFTNVVLHRIIGWLVCTTPIAWIALCLYSSEDRSRQ